MEDEWNKSLSEEEKKKSVRPMSPVEVYQMEKEMKKYEKEAEKNDPYRKLEKMLLDMPQKLGEIEKTLK